MKLECEKRTNGEGKNDEDMKEDGNEKKRESHEVIDEEEGKKQSG